MFGKHFIQQRPEVERQLNQVCPVAVAVLRIAKHGFCQQIKLNHESEVLSD